MRMSRMRLPVQSLGVGYMRQTFSTHDRSGGRLWSDMGGCPSPNDRVRVPATSVCSSSLRLAMDALLRRLILPRHADHGVREVAAVRDAMRASKRPREALSEASSESEETASEPRTTVPKSTYYKRKNEIKRLQIEMERLRARLQVLEEPTLQRELDMLKASVIANSDLKNELHGNRAVLATIDSMFASYRARSISMSPLNTCIRLSSDPFEREQTLQALKKDKLEDARKFIQARCEFVDLSRSCKEYNFYDAENGDKVSLVWQVTPVEEATSAKDLFDAVRYFEETEELGLTEKLGVITIREGGGDDLGSVMQSRLVLSFSKDVEVELNHALFSHFYESKNGSPSCGIIVANQVDEDELFPYQTAKRIRQDVSSIIFVTEVPQADPKVPPLVVLVLWGFVRVHKTGGTRSRDLDLVCQEGVARWCDVMLSCVLERLTWRATTTQ